MAGNGGKKDAYKKKRAEHDGGSGGEMHKRAAGGHDDSPHVMIRMAGPGDFRA